MTHLSPLVLVHGFMDTPRTWDLVRPALEREHHVLAPALPGHAGGPPIDGAITDDFMVDALEQVMDEAGLATAHIAGNSLGGYLALRLAARGRAGSVVAFSPAGGWADGDPALAELLAYQRNLHEQAKAYAPQADALMATPEGRRRATAMTAVHWDHIPADLLADQLRAVAACEAAPALTEHALRAEWTLDAERITCPVRIVWGLEDRLARWPAAAVRYRRWLPHAEWIELEGVGHCPQLDVPLETAQLILGLTR